MTKPVGTFVVDGNKYRIEHSKSHGNLFKTLNDWVGASGGAYDMMNTMKKIAILSGNQYAASQLGTYVAGTAVPRLPGAAHALYEDCQKVRKEPITANLAAKVAHGITEVGAMAAFTVGFFNRGNPAIGNAGVVLNALSDVAEVGVYGTDLRAASHLLSFKGTAEEGMGALRAKSTHSMLKLAKSVLASVTGFFSSYAIVMKSVLVCSTTAVTISLACSLLNCFAFYHKNYISDGFADLKAIPLTA